MPAIAVDQCFALPPTERADGLAALPEDQWFERKSIRVSPRTFAEALTGFANAEGGTVVVGLSTGLVEDVSSATKAVNRLRRAPFDLTSPPVRAQIEEVEVRGAEGRPAYLLVARVSPGDSVHELTDGEVYLRVGDSTMRLSPAQREELLYDRGAAQYEARPVGHIDVDDLDAVQLEGYRRAVGSAYSSDHQVLQARSLLTPRDEVTVAGYLLFAPDPTTLMPHAQVRVLRYDSTDRGTGSRQSLLAGGDIRIQRGVPVAIHEAIDVVEEWMPHRRALRADGRFGDVPIVPHDAWVEGLVNAVVHRSYSAAGDHVRVEVFPDRIEISSPGRFPGMVDPDRPLDIARYARNPRIARVCSDLALTQELGEGIRRMFDEMRAAGLQDPAYRQTSGSVRLTLTALTRVPPEVLARLPRGSDVVLGALRTAGRALGTGQVAHQVARARPWTIARLNALEDAGLVVWSGTSAKDPRATWELRDR